MSTYYKILLGIIVLVYFISPIDIIPDIFIPYLGWIDDTFLIGLFLYYLKFGRLPDFLSKKKKSASKNWNRTRTENQQNRADDFNRFKKAKDTQNTEKSRSADKKPEDILGVKKGASKEEIRAAYRKAVKDYHPDRVAHLGKEFQELANEKFLEIKAAYDTLMNT